MPFYVYILRSLNDGNLYTGMSQDPERRLRQHNAGQTRSLKQRRPLVLVYKEEHSTRSAAISRELFLKTAEGGATKAQLIAEYGARDEAVDQGRQHS
jgi:putative endonuclease